MLALLQATNGVFANQSVDTVLKGSIPVGLFHGCGVLKSEGGEGVPHERTQL